LSKGLITILSPLAAVNVFVRRVRCAGTLASGGRWTRRNALVRRYDTMGWQMST